MNKEKVVQHTMKFCSAIKKMKFVICNNMDGSWEYYAKWNKLDVSGQKIVWFQSCVRYKKR